MSSASTADLNEILEATEGTYVRITLTRYACGESFALFGLFLSPLTAFQQ
jgi:hypothetical protein